jgi:hypothetical protein
LKALGNGNDKIVSLLATTQLNATKLAIVLVFVDGGTLHDAIHDSKEEVRIPFPKSHHCLPIHD